MHSFTMVLANERERHSVKVTNVLAVAPQTQAMAVQYSQITKV